MAILEIRGLHVFYGQAEAVHGIDLDVKEGSVTVIIGSNGAGKTTILNAVSGMVRRTGSIVFGGAPLSPKPHKVVQSKIIHVPEGRRVFAGLTVEENLRLGAYNNTDKKAVRALMEKQFELFPRLGERRGQDSGTLSGGEQQMLAIARGLMAEPRLLMLDEPSLGLAPIIVTEIFRTIKAIHDDGITVMLVEQNAKKSLGICDFAYVLENGCIIDSGTGRSLLENPVIAKAYLGASKG